MTTPAQIRLVVLYHSNYGHTRRVAYEIARGADPKVPALAIDVKDLMASTQTTQSLWQIVDQAGLIAFGSAVYMGSATADFKAFMDSTSKRWLERTWQGKLAAGFANSGGLSGDKLAVLQQICLFAMQHGMNWVGMPLMPTGSSESDLNRLSSFLGLMTQSHNAPPDETPPIGDMQTAYWFGEHLAMTLLSYGG